LRILLFAALGAVTGSAAIELTDLVSAGSSLYVFPGFVFGLAFGAVLYRLKLVGLPGGAVYLLTSTLSHAAAVFLAIAILKSVESMFGHDDNINFAVIGFIAGGLGSAFLGGATAFLIRCRRWPLLIVAGAVLGAVLPLIKLDDIGGPYLFYAIWQAGYAATFAALLPRAGQTSGDPVS